MPKLTDITSPATILNILKQAKKDYQKTAPKADHAAETRHTAIVKGLDNLKQFAKKKVPQEKNNQIETLFARERSAAYKHLADHVKALRKEKPSDPNKGRLDVYLKKVGGLTISVRKLEYATLSDKEEAVTSLAGYEDPSDADMESVEKAAFEPAGAREARQQFAASREQMQEIEAFLAVRPGQVAESTDAWAARIDPAKCSLGRALKSGAMGTVSLVDSTDPQTPALVAKTPSSGRFVRALETEVDFYKKIGDHPNIAKCLGMRGIKDGSGKETNALVMEAVKGKDLDGFYKEMRQRLEKGEVSQEKYWGVMQFSLARTLETLAFVEMKQVVHRDIKPDNIMLDADTGEVKLIDFGVAVEADGQVKQLGGTFGFMAPEVQEGRSTAKADIFSVGGTAFEVGEGKRPSALQAGDAANPASAVDAQGQRSKVEGRYAAETHYTEFVQWLMNADPTLRPTAKQALCHPFMKDRLLSDQQANEIVKESLRPREAADLPGVMAKAVDLLKQKDIYASIAMTINGLLDSYEKSDKSQKTQEDTRYALREYPAKLGKSLQDLRGTIAKLEHLDPAKSTAKDRVTVAAAKAVEELKKLEADVAKVDSRLRDSLKHLDDALEEDDTKYTTDRIKRGFLLSKNQIAAKEKELDSAIETYKATLQNLTPAAIPFPEKIEAAAQALMDRMKQSSALVSAEDAKSKGWLAALTQGPQDEQTHDACARINLMRGVYSKHQGELVHLIRPVEAVRSIAEKQVLEDRKQADLAIASVEKLTKLAEARGYLGDRKALKTLQGKSTDQQSTGESLKDLESEIREAANTLSAVQKTMSPVPESGQPDYYRKVTDAIGQLSSLQALVEAESRLTATAEAGAKDRMHELLRAKVAPAAAVAADPKAMAMQALEKMKETTKQGQEVVHSLKNYNEAAAFFQKLFREPRNDAKAIAMFEKKRALYLDFLKGLMEKSELLLGRITAAAAELEEFEAQLKPSNERNAQAAVQLLAAQRPQLQEAETTLLGLRAQMESDLVAYTATEEART